MVHSKKVIGETYYAVSIVQFSFRSSLCWLLQGVSRISKYITYSQILLRWTQSLCLLHTEYFKFFLNICLGVELRVLRISFHFSLSILVNTEKSFSNFYSGIQHKLTTWGERIGMGQEKGFSSTSNSVTSSRARGYSLDTTIMI